MAKRRKKSTIEYFYFTIDDWTRSYKFEVNRHKWELAPDHYDERDEIEVTGRLRSKTKRKITSGIAHILPSYLPREEIEKDGANRIGNVWVEKQALHCSAFIPSDAYFSLPMSFRAQVFKEMEWRVNNLWYGKGQMDSLELSNELSDLNSH